MRPLDQKLKYQIDKLVRTAVTGSLGKSFILTRFVIDRTYEEQSLTWLMGFLSAENDPLHFRPNPHNLVSKVMFLLIKFI